MKKRIWLLRLITFLASFLLFQIQFIIGKIFLANFGGGFMVWGACLVFFQAVLLLGYLYAHWMTKKFTIAKYLAPHTLLLLAPFLFFPGRRIPMVYQALGFPMVADVFLHLLMTIGLVFFALSTMSIISQAWLASSELPQKNNPYALFSVSNFGSLLALISYPFVFEMIFDLRQQQNIWRILYIFTVVLYVIGVRLIRAVRREDQDNLQKDPVPRVLIWQWFLYGAAGVTAFLAVTNIITSEIAPMPLLWMLPLFIYLLSYVLNFKSRPWFPGWMGRTINITTGFGVVVYFLTVRQTAPALVDMVFMLVFVFIICMFCQRRLYVLRPESQDLTLFYFIISLGGFFGGAVTTWIIPLIFVNYAEYFLGLIFLFAAWFLEEKDTGNQRTLVSFIVIVFLTAAVYFGPFFLKHNGLLGLAGFALFIMIGFHVFRKNRAAALAFLVLLLIALDTFHPAWLKQTYIYGKRNYYGITRVVERGDLRMLFQGTTMHGTQYLDPERSYIPLSYYHPKSPPAQLLINEKGYKSAGMIGLGTGSLAMYGRPDQKMDFYELDKDILVIAQKYFSYLHMAQAQIRHFIDDARIGLEKNEDARYDILIVDAFSGNSVPVHLLTQECLELYRSRSAPDGIILFHLANRYINLPMAFIHTAASTKAYILYINDGHSGSDWVAVTYDPLVYYRLLTDYGWTAVNKSKYEDFRPWTDQYSNLLPYFLRSQVFSSFLENWDVR